ncbi:ferredoxin [Candidatus Woesearchaeota archaeon]|nr:ferredoxin [Candidatus Woesearchaeota archaeon]
MGKKYKIVYDKKNCIGGLICVDIAPEFWRMDGAVATINNQKATKDKDKEELIFDEKDLSHNLEAAEGCPVAVIKIIDLETGEQLYPKE